jgi:DNA-3-methyladenine glycosylase I
MTRPDLVVGRDGYARCGWATDDDSYQRYHDEEWGIPLHGDRALFEKLSLEAFQSGLSWITILRRRPAFREAFRSFEPGIVSAFTDEDVERLLADDRIVRNGAKIRATIANARVVDEFTRNDPGALDRLLWSFAPPPSARRSRLADLPAQTRESAAAAGALKKLGIRFVGATTMYALMQSVGMVDDHLSGCFRSEIRGALAGSDHQVE